MKQNSILITGAASGLGRALALKLAEPGRILHMFDRNAAGLSDTATRVQALGATCRQNVIDVRQREAMRKAVSASETLDLVFACAGVTGGTHQPSARHHAPYEPEEQVTAMMDINLGGVINTILPAIDVIRAQSPAPDGLRGRICAISSVAGVVSFPGTPSYCAAKAAVDRFVVATGGNLRREGILLSSVVCGFISTPMAASNEFPMPGLVQVHEATDRILRGLARNTRRIVFPRWMVAGSRLMDLLPVRLAELYYTTQPTGAPGTMPELIDSSARGDRAVGYRNEPL